MIVLTVTGYFGLLDMGVMSALTKYISEYRGAGYDTSIGRLINTSFTFYVGIGVISAVSLFFFSNCFDYFFTVTDANKQTVKNLFLVAALFSPFLWSLGTFRGVIEGLNLWHLEAYVSIIGVLLNAVTAVFVFKVGYSIVAYFVALQIINTISSVVYFIIAKRKISHTINFPSFEIKTMKIIFRFSSYMFVGSLISILLFQVHNFIIGYFLSISAVTIFAVAYNIQTYFRYVNSAIGAPPWILASEMEGRCDYVGQKKLLLKGTKYMSAVLVPMVLIVMVYAEPFIKFWMGPGFEDSVLPARIIVAFWIFNGTIELATGMLSAKGFVSQPLKIQLLVAISNIILSLFLIKYLGLPGVAMGLSLSMILIGLPLYLRLALRLLKVSLSEYFHSSIKKNIIIYTIVAGLSILMISYCYPPNLIMTVLQMAVVYLFALAIYYLMFLTSEERREIGDFLGLKAR